MLSRHGQAHFLLTVCAPIYELLYDHGQEVYQNFAETSGGWPDLQFINILKILGLNSPQTSINIYLSFPRFLMQCRQQKTYGWRAGQWTSNLESPLNFVVTARCVTLGTLDTQWAAGNLCPGVGAADLTSCDIIEISGRNIPNPDTHYDISVIYLKFWCDGGRQVTLGWRAGRQAL